MHRLLLLAIACGTTQPPIDRDARATAAPTPPRVQIETPARPDYAELCRRATRAGACHDRARVSYGRLDARSTKALALELELRSPTMTIPACSTLGSPMALECVDTRYLDACLPTCTRPIRDCDLGVDPDAFDTEEGRRAYERGCD